MAFEDLSTEDLRNKLAQAEHELAALGRAREERHQARKGDIAQEVRNLILAAGYDLDEILPLVAVKARRRARATAVASDSSFPAYADPENPQRAYVRGVLPGWMKALITEKGYDPKDKASREAFKANVLVRQG